MHRVFTTAAEGTLISAFKRRNDFVIVSWDFEANYEERTTFLEGLDDIKYYREYPSLTTRSRVINILLDREKEREKGR